MPDETPPLFTAEIRPYRSASERGIFIVVVFMAGVCFAVGVAFLVIGAWPVFGFLGLDVVLLYGALRFNHGSGRMVEWVTLTPDQLTIVRRDAWGRMSERCFDPRGLLVVVEADTGGVDQVTLNHRGERFGIGGHLAVEDRPRFARSLRQALAKVPMRPRALAVPAARCAPCRPATY